MWGSKSQRVCRKVGSTMLFVPHPLGFLPRKGVSAVIVKRQPIITLSLRIPISDREWHCG